MRCCALAPIIQLLARPEEVRTARRAFFSFPSKGSPLLLQRQSSLSPFVSAETVKACALIGSHWVAAEGESGSCGSQSPDSGDMERHGCPKSPDWDSDGESKFESEGLSSSDFSGAQCGKPCFACYRAELARRKGVLFLEDWELARVVFGCHIALDMFCQAMDESW